MIWIFWTKLIRDWKKIEASHAQPHRHFSLKLFNYVLREYLIVLLCCLGAFLTLFIVASIYDDLAELLKHGADIRLIVYYIFLLQPQHLIHVIPISLLITTVYVVSNLCRYNELTALRASGLSILQIGLPIVGAAIISGVTLLVITEKIAPSATLTATLLKKKLSDPYGKRSKQEKTYLAFRNKDDRRDWFFKNFDGNGVSYQVNVTQFRPDRSVAWELVAEEAEYTNRNWRFRNSVVRRFDSEGYLLAEKPCPHEILELPELTENPRGFSFLFNLRPLEEYSASSLFGVISTHKASLTEQTSAILKTYFFYYLFLPFGCLVAIAIGIPLAITEERGSITLNFIIAAATLAVYQLVTQCFIVLGKNQVISPILAGAIPLFVFAGLGIWLLKNKI